MRVVEIEPYMIGTQDYHDEHFAMIQTYKLTKNIPGVTFPLEFTVSVHYCETVKYPASFTYFPPKLYHLYKGIPFNNCNLLLLQYTFQLSLIFIFSYLYSQF